MNDLTGFSALGLSDNSLYAIGKKGFEEPTDIQKQTIPLLLKGENDIVAQAQTGTGKTAAFALPLIERLEPGAKYPSAIILTPTRELALQVSEEINSLKGKKHFSILPIYGGQSIEQQISKLKRGVDIVVGTPGRVIDHIERKTLNLELATYFILDEADEMLNMGFIDDVELILSKTAKEKHVLLFSATIPERIRQLSKKYLHNPITVVVKKEQLTTELAEQIYFEVQESDRLEALCRIIDMEKEFYGLIFCRTKIDADRLSNKLIDRSYSADALHGDLSQSQRERILTKFKKKQTNILVATDVAARGIDIINLTHVINYSLPQDPESYVHRIGRTGRAGKQGIAITFITPSEYRNLVFIKKIAKTDIRKAKLPEIDDIINTKKDRIREDLLSIIENGEHLDYMDVSKKLLSGGRSAEEMLAAFLKYTMKDEFDRSSYSEIRNVSVDRQGTTRLFIAMGEKDRMTKKKLVEMICSETGIPSSKIKDVSLFEKFSFITVPFEEAEIIIEVFQRRSKGRRSIIEKAKPGKKK